MDRLASARAFLVFALPRDLSWHHLRRLGVLPAPGNQEAQFPEPVARGSDHNADPRCPIRGRIADRVESRENRGHPHARNVEDGKWKVDWYVGKLVDWERRKRWLLYLMGHLH